MANYPYCFMVDWNLSSTHLQEIGLTQIRHTMLVVQPLDKIKSSHNPMVMTLAYV